MKKLQLLKVRARNKRGRLYLTICANPEKGPVFPEQKKCGTAKFVTYSIVSQITKGR